MTRNYLDWLSSMPWSVHSKDICLREEKICVRTPSTSKRRGRSWTETTMVWPTSKIASESSLLWVYCVVLCKVLQKRSIALHNFG